MEADQLQEINDNNIPRIKQISVRWMALCFSVIQNTIVVIIVNIITIVIFWTHKHKASGVEKGDVKCRGWGLDASPQSPTEILWKRKETLTNVTGSCQ